MRRAASARARRATAAITRRRRCAAFHEAAHAVARLFIGAPLTSVEINDRGGGFAHGKLGRRWIARRWPLRGWDLVLCAMAGPCAEARVSHRSVVQVVLRAGLDDLEQTKLPVMWLVAHGYARDPDTAWTAGCRRTRWFLSQRWAAIERVAEALLRRGRLSGRQVRKLARI
jgi:hypothetical protein